jgi:CubicO group peptidase (beta-lactamase class C family)
MKNAIQHSPHTAPQSSDRAARATLLQRRHGWASAAAVIGTLALTACGGGGNDGGPKIDTQAAQSAVEQFRAASARPGMSAAIASDHRLLWTGVSGYADVSAKRAPSESTPYFTGSVGKLVTVAAAMQLVESGKVQLDADISGVLGYKVENPAFPGQPITLRHLLSHVSGIQDNGFLAVSKSQVEFLNRDPDLKLLDFCRAMLAPDGAFQWRHRQPRSIAMWAMRWPVA